MLFSSLLRRHSFRLTRYSLAARCAIRGLCGIAHLVKTGKPSCRARWRRAACQNQLDGVRRGLASKLGRANACSLMQRQPWIFRVSINDCLAHWWRQFTFILFGNGGWWSRREKRSHSRLVPRDWPCSTARSWRPLFPQHALSDSPQKAREGAKFRIGSALNRLPQGTDLRPLVRRFSPFVALFGHRRSFFPGPASATTP
jgi:hypothetical protein